MKGIELGYELPEGATAFIVPIKTNIKELYIKEDMISYTTFDNSRDTGFSNHYLEDFIVTYSQLQSEDKFYFKYSCVNCDHLKGSLHEGTMDDTTSSEGCEFHSRIRVKDCLSVEIKRVQDINKQEIKKCVGENSFIIGDDFEQFKFNKRKFEELCGVGENERNDYVFIYTFEGIQDV